MTDLDRFKFNTKDTAAIMGVSVQAFSQWRIESLEKKGRAVFYDIREVIKNRINKASETGGTDAKLDLFEQQARLAKERADKAEMENDLARGETIEVAPAMLVLEKTILAIRQRILAIPKKGARSLVGLKTMPQAEGELDTLIRDALEELGTINPAALCEVSGNTAEVQATAKTNDKPVGRQKKKVKRRK